MFLGQLIEFQVSLARISKFLLCDEINETLVQDGKALSPYSKSVDDKMVIEVNDGANFHWGAK